MTTTISGTDGVSAHATGSVVQQDIGDNVVGKGPCFLANRITSSISVASGPTALPYNNKTFDTNNNYNTSTGTFTASIAGYYNFSASCYFTELTAPVHLSFLKNGTIAANGNFNAMVGTVSIVALNALLYLGVNDTVFTAFYGSGATLQAQPENSRFSGFLVRAA